MAHRIDESNPTVKPEIVHEGDFFHPKHDAADHYYTFKPIHNVYDPAKGELRVAVGPPNLHPYVTHRFA